MRTNQSAQVTAIVCMMAITLVLAAACSQNSPLSVGLAPTPANERVMPTPAMQPGASTTPTLLVPTPTPKGFYAQSYTNIGEFSLDFLVYISDAIVKVGPPISIIDSIETVPSSEDNVAPTYRPIIEFEFPVHEYLKGAGDTTMLIIDSTAHTYLSISDAKESAQSGVADRNTEWDDRAAVLFLRTRPIPGQGAVSGAYAASAYQFAAGTPTTGQPRAWAAYAVDQRGNAWMPTSAASQASGSSNSDNNNPRFISDSPDRFPIIHNLEAIGAGQKPSEVSLQEVRSRIASVTALAQSGRGVEGYERCIQNMYVGQLWVSGWEKAHGRPYAPSSFLLAVPSGKEAGFVIHDGYEVANPYFGYTDRWFTGADAALFRTSRTDGDARGETGYNYAYHTTRPLPNGAYNIDYNTLTSMQRPCNDSPNISSWVVTVTAPAGAVHEAFFDPVAIGSAIGADAAANGALEPTTFTVNGTSTTLQSLKWDNTGIITLTLNPNASLTGLALDFIALDGSVALTLSSSAAKSDGAAGTIRWSSATAPWSAGDQLMLRIRNEGAAPIPTPTPTPTAAPTPTPTPTHTPTPPAALPPGGVSGQ